MSTAPALTIVETDSPVVAYALTATPAVERNVRRWLERVRPDQGGHWPWPGRLNAEGYGRLIVRTHRGEPRRGLPGRPVELAAHRAAWAVLVGPVPAGHYVVSTCGRRDCVRPKHHRLVAPDTVGAA